LVFWLIEHLTAQPFSVASAPCLLVCVLDPTLAAAIELQERGTMRCGTRRLDVQGFVADLVDCHFLGVF